MKLVIIVGAGGTGSYFIEDVVHYFNALKGKRHIVVVDGDVVEEKNLLRQGFLKKDLHKGKAESLVSRYRKIVREDITIEAKNQFINSVEDVLEIAMEDNYSEITLVSCVDNNMARLRLTFAMYALRDVCKVEVRFVDSGNAEWHGQTITSVLAKTGETYLQGLHKEIVNKGRKGAVGYKVKGTDTKHILAGIFTTNDDWKNNLTKGDHELSCDDVTESSPQNIGTNMMAAKCLLMTMGMLERKEFTGGEYNFDASTNSLTRKYEGVQIEEGYTERLSELVDYVKTEEGFREVFGEDLVEEVEVEVEEIEEVMVLEDKKPKKARVRKTTVRKESMLGDKEDIFKELDELNELDRTELDDDSLDLFLGIEEEVDLTVGDVTLDLFS